MLAAAVGSNLTKLLHDILDLMFAYGLSEHLRQCLTHISAHIPPLLGAIQGKHSNFVAFSHQKSRNWNRTAPRFHLARPRGAKLQTFWRTCRGSFRATYN